MNDGGFWERRRGKGVNEWVNELTTDSNWRTREKGLTHTKTLLAPSNIYVNLLYQILQFLIEVNLILIFFSECSNQTQIYFDLNNLYFFYLYDF